MSRKFRVGALVVFINAMAAVGAVLAYYAYAKITYPNYFCGGFAAIDAEIGWVNKPNAANCIGGREAFSSGPAWFEGKVFTDSNGFRSEKQGGPTPNNGIMIVGDSWTFGYGVDFADSLGGRLQKHSGIPVVVAASPGYGAAQALALADRWTPRIAPRAIVYLDFGLWDRSACMGTTPPRAILKPCYWQAPGSQRGVLASPPPGRVERFAAWGVLPGGMLGAGEDSWLYFLVSRPITVGYQLLTRAGLMSGFGHDFRAVGVDPAAIQHGVFDHMTSVAAKTPAPFLIIDSHGTYADDFSALASDRKTNLHYVGKDPWLYEVDEPERKLPRDQARVPNDGHFGPGTNDLAAAMIWKRLGPLLEGKGS